MNEISKFNINDPVTHLNETGIVKSKQYMEHMDMYIYLVKFGEFKIILRENELEKYNE